MKKILIIEDDESICKELSVLLANAGYEAMILKDFEHALKECLSAQADLILLDIHIPCIAVAKHKKRKQCSYHHGHQQQQ